MSLAAANGFTPMIPPALVKPRAMEGTGFLGQAAQDVYRLEADDLYLVGTSEVPLAAYHSDEILDADALPLPLRRLQPLLPPRGRLPRQGHPRHLPGALVRQGRDVRLLRRRRRRTPSTSDCWSWEKQFIDALEIPYQVQELASGDLGLSAARKYDCCAWIPTQRRYREITSTSNCTEFQARRLNIRARFADGTGPVATLNGTLCAMTRMIVMLLENHQQADGSVRVPAALQPYLGGRTVRLDDARGLTASS